MSHADDDGRENSVFVWIKNNIGYEKQKWYRPFTGSGLKDSRIAAAYELKPEQESLSLDELAQLFPQPEWT